MEKLVHTIISDRMERGEKQLAVLIDPDKADKDHLEQLLSPQNLKHIDLVFVGGSVLTAGDIDSCLTLVNQHLEGTDIPSVIFPGSADQISDKADAILLLSLISGRNPELLIGKHVASAASLKRSNLEIIPTGYILIDGGISTTVSYISATVPIPASKPGLAAMTALAGEQLGLALSYLDAGSGALQPVSSEIIQAVREVTDTPIVVGGGIRNAEGIQKAWNAGADVVVVGNALEEDPVILEGLKRSIAS